MSRQLKQYRINHESFIGFKVGKLTVVRFLKVMPRKSNIGNHYYYECLCECGELTVATKQNLKASKNKDAQCGCKKCVSKNVTDRNINKPPKWNDKIDKEIASIMSEYNTRAAKKQIDFDLAHSDFKMLCLQNCYYCNIKPDEFRETDDKPKTGLMRLNYNGLDRIDNRKGYSKNNVVACCEDCNKAKRNLSQNDFLNLIKQIYENRISSVNI